MEFLIFPLLAIGSFFIYRTIVKYQSNRSNISTHATKVGKEPQNDNLQSLRELNNKLFNIKKDISFKNPILNAEDARMIGSILCQEPRSTVQSLADKLEAEIRKQAYEIAFHWANSDGGIVSDFKMLEQIKDTMTDEEISQYKALKESDRNQVEKGLKLALLAVLSAEKDKKSNP